MLEGGTGKEVGDIASRLGEEERSVTRRREEEVGEEKKGSEPAAGAA